MDSSPSPIALAGLGAIAGLVPVYLGIGIALGLRRVLSRGAEGALIGVANGVLVYLFFDLMHEAIELTGIHDPGSWLLFLGSLGVSFIGIVALEQFELKKKGHSRLLTLPYMVALGMGLHNLGEGLAIGASYAQGQWGLSVMLVLGFALHNGTEGFGIIGAAGRAAIQPRDVLLLGLVAGVPTCLGTIVSGAAVSHYATILFYTLGAGSLLYVILGLTTISYTSTRRLQVASGVFIGISLMYLTAMLLALAGGPRS